MTISGAITARRLALAAAAGSAALLLGALAFQYIGGLFPCKLCIWQRWPHGLAIAAGVVLVAVPSRVLMWLGAAGAAGSASVGVYHTGVERAWWQGPDTCTSGSIEGLSPDQLLAQIMNAPVVRCDEVPWEMLTLSMASWNAILSAALAVLWIVAATRRA